MQAISLTLLLTGSFSCQQNEQRPAPAPDAMQTQHRHAVANHPAAKKVSYDFSQAQSGDVILKHGKGWISNRIVRILNEKVKISHCGILIRENDSLYIVHSVAKEVSGSDGVQSISLKDFLRDTAPGSLFLVRLKEPEEARKQIAAQALYYLKQRTPFDYDYDYEDDSKIYCSELVYHAVVNASGKDCFKKKMCNKCNLILFNSLLDTACFSILPVD